MSFEIETERLLLRYYDLTDSEDALRYLGDPVNMHFLPESPFDKDSIVSFIHKAMLEQNYIAVVLKETEQVIGHLYFEAFGGNHSYEIGWIFAQSFNGKGYAYESAKALLNWAFKENGIHRIIATCQPENKNSYRLMEKLGMRREGYFKECIQVANNTWWDEYYYAILSSEWEYQV